MHTHADGIETHVHIQLSHIIIKRRTRADRCSKQTEEKEKYERTTERKMQKLFAICMKEKKIKEVERKKYKGTASQRCERIKNTMLVRNRK